MIHHADFDAIEYETEGLRSFQRSPEERWQSQSHKNKRLSNTYPANLPTGYLEAREADAAMNTDLVYAGGFDGVIGLDANPEFWGKSDSYEHGYLTGVRKRFNKLYKVELAVEPF